MNVALCASDTGQHELTRMPAAGSLPSTMILWKQAIEMEKAQRSLPQSIAPDQNNRQLHLRPPRSFGFGPPCLLSCPDVCQASRTDLLPGFLNGFGCQRLTLCSHSLCNSGTNVGKSLGAHLPLGFLCRFSSSRCPFNLRPSSLLSGTHSSPTRCADLALLGCFWRGCFSRTTQKLTEFFLEQLNPLLNIGCFTELLRCYVDHDGRSVDRFEVEVKWLVLNPS